MQALLAFLAVSLVASAFPVEVVDDRGKTILIAQEPGRIVVAGIPLYAEVLLDLGLLGRMVGVADSPIFPRSLRKHLE